MVKIKNYEQLSDGSYGYVEREFDEVESNDWHRCNSCWFNTRHCPESVNCAAQNRKDNKNIFFRLIKGKKK